jgi:hypothetical protein
MKVDVSETVARDILAATEAVGKSLSDLNYAVRKIENAEDRRVLLHCVGDLMGDLYERIMRPIITTHPFLDPDKESE